MSQINNRWPIIAALMALLITVAGCSSSSNDGSGIDPDTGNHIENWIGVHGGEFIKTFFSDPGLCKECHGSDPVFRGGISDVSCFNTQCHNSSNGAPIAHPDTAQWNEPGSHGSVAKMAPGTESGFTFCQVCHGTTNTPFFGGGVFGATCFTCHGIAAPHPQAWVSHSSTDPGNASVCALCHRNANPGTPGCFNNTLCHAVVDPHPANWPSPTVHGPVAKAAPGATSGFFSCEACHGTNFGGGTSGVACQSCHGIAAPHPSAWMPGDIYSHTTTNPENASVCAQCHRNANPGTPGCFNSTLCHGAINNHPANWSTSTVHGPVAKAAPGTTSGLFYCEVCHGPFTPGGTFTCQNCHNAPHAPAPWRGGASTHTTTDPGNAPVCAQCHRQNPGTAGCFNNTLCHGAINPHPANWSTSTVHGPVAKAAPGATSGLFYCEVCHGPFTPGGTFTCQNCHTPPHASASWIGGGSAHMNTDEGNAPVCAQCHRQNPGTAGCFNNTLCHG